MNDKNLPGVSFEPIRFKPTASKYADEEIAGLRFTITDRDKLEAVKTGVALMTQLAKDYPDKWERKNADTLLLNAETLDKIFAGKELDEITKSWQDDLARFNEKRAAYLIYR